MTCPDIYIGNSRSEAPPNPFWQNPAIDPPSTTMTEGDSVSIAVTVRNHGTQDSPDTKLQLYWSDPTTGFAAVAGRKIGEFDFSQIDAAITFPASDGVASHNFAWTVTGSTVNGGHVCLLARVRNNSAPADMACSQEIFGSDPTTDKLQGIRNIHVNEMAMFRADPSDPDRGDDGKFMQFAFAATNTLLDTEDTQLTVRVLDPSKDREALQTLVSDRLVDRALRRRRLKFAVPNALLVAPGRERVLVPNFLALGKDPREGRPAPCAPRLSRTGPLSLRRFKHLVAPGEKAAEAKKPIDLKLLPGEMRQTIVQIERSGKDKAVYAVEVRHESAKGKPIGGLTILFVPPHDYF
jgi:hypothetical protein